MNICWWERKFFRSLVVLKGTVQQGVPPLFFFIIRTCPRKLTSGLKYVVPSLVTFPDNNYSSETRHQSHKKRKLKKLWNWQQLTVDFTRKKEYKKETTFHQFYYSALYSQIYKQDEEKNKKGPENTVCYTYLLFNFGVINCWFDNSLLVFITVLLEDSK